MDLGTDINCYPDLDPAFGLVTGFTCLAQCLARCLATPRGSLPYAPNRGTDLRQFVNEAVTPSLRARVQMAIERECEQDERVMGAKASVSWDASGNMKGSVLITTQDGITYPTTLLVTQLSVSLLTSLT